METDYLDRLTALPVRPSSTTIELQRFERVRLQGNFGEAVYLVDNQVHHGKPGYWVVQSFEDKRSGRFLVNRGFVAAPALREELPAVVTPAGEVEVIGAVWPFTGLIPVLDEDIWPNTWPKRVQRLDVARMATEIDAVPLELRLEPGQPGVTVAAPFAQVLSDDKHRGYAATWFGLAIALVVLYITLGFKAAGADERAT